VTENIASTLHFNDLESLLIQDSSRVFTQEKWYKSLVEGTINISDVLYNLKVTSNKDSQCILMVNSPVPNRKTIMI
jgi:hypothetical protein